MKERCDHDYYVQAICKCNHPRNKKRDCDAYNGKCVFLVNDEKITQIEMLIQILQRMIDSQKNEIKRLEKEVNS